MVLSAYNGGAPSECTPQAEAAARKALSLDEGLSDAVAVLASAKAEYYFDFAGARAEYERAIRLNANDATAHHWFASDVLASTGDQAGNDPTTQPPGAQRADMRWTKVSGFGR